MKTWTDWETISHHVSICGQVLNTSGKPMPGVHLDLTPQGTQTESQSGRSRSVRSRGKATMAQTERADSGISTWKETKSRPDGTFFFLDCPEGDYMVKAVDTRSGVRAQQIVNSNAGAMRKPVKDRKPSEGYGIELVLK
jgi:hypothetical protein